MAHLMRSALVNQTVEDIMEYLEDAFFIADKEVVGQDVFKIVDNNLGFIVDAIDEDVIEIEVSDTQPVEEGD